MRSWVWRQRTRIVMSLVFAIVFAIARWFRWETAGVPLSNLPTPSRAHDDALCAGVPGGFPRLRAPPAETSGLRRRANGARRELEVPGRRGRPRLPFGSMLDYHTHLLRHGEDGPYRADQVRAYAVEAGRRGVEEIAIPEHLFRFRQADALLRGWWDDDPSEALRAQTMRYWDAH